MFSSAAGAPRLRSSPLPDARTCVPCPVRAASHAGIGAITAITERSMKSVVLRFGRDARHVRRCRAACLAPDATATRRCAARASTSPTTRVQGRVDPDSWPGHERRTVPGKGRSARPECRIHAEHLRQGPRDDQHRQPESAHCKQPHHVGHAALQRRADDAGGRHPTLAHTRGGPAMPPFNSARIGAVRREKNSRRSGR